MEIIYNYYLNKSIQDYQQNKDKKWNKYEYVKDILNLKRKWTIKKDNSQSLQSVVENLDKAYNKFFTKWWWFPSFKRTNKTIN